MSLFRRLMTVLGAGGAGYQAELQKDANIFSAHNLCASVAFEELTTSPSSAYSVSLLFEELVVSPGTTAIFFCKITGGAITASLASTYDLSTAVT